MSVALNVVFAVALLVLTASGLAITFGLMGVINFAHGDFIMFGAYVAVLLAGTVPFALVVLIAGLAVGLYAIPVERGLIRPLYTRPLETILATYGLGIVMRETIRVFVGGDYRSVAAPLDSSITLFGATYPVYRLVIVAAAVAIFIALLALVRSSRVGTVVRAVIESPTLAASQGINVGRTYTSAFALGGVLAGVAGALVSPLVSTFPDMGFEYVINGFLAVLIGGAGSILGFGLTGTVMAGTESLFDRWVDPTLGGIFVLVVAVALIRLRPNGLLVRR